MNTFFFQIEVEPLPGNQHSENVAGAIVQMFVTATDGPAAEKRAFTIISDLGWAILKVQGSEHILPQQLAAMDTRLKSDYLKAQTAGFSCYFRAWAKKGHPADCHPVPLIKPPRKLLH